VPGRSNATQKKATKPQHHHKASPTIDIEAQKERDQMNLIAW
jgi:hypothetical protein